MKIDMKQHLKNLNGMPFDDLPNFLLGEAAKEALLSTYNDETEITGEEKFNRYQIAMKVQKGLSTDEEVDFAIEELALIKKLIGKRYNTVVVGPAFLALESK